MGTRSIWLPLLLWAGAAALWGCGEAGAGAPSPGPEATFAALFDSIGGFELEENATTINVAPVATPDERGGFIVVDAKESQGRLYDGHGKLLRAFGRDGQGPGEFQAPMVGRRMPSGEILVVDAIEARVTFMDPSGARIVRTSRAPLLPLYDAIPRSDSTLLLVGRRPGGQRSPLLHLWNLRTGEIERSFFPTPGGQTVQQLAASLGWADAAVRGDTVAAVFAMTDTLFLFAPDGALRGRVPLPFRSFTVPQPPSDRARTDPRARMEWMRTVQQIFDVFWLADGSFLVQYARQNGTELEWGLLHATRGGERIFDLSAAPRLMAVRGDSLYFVDPRSEVPSRWRIARLHSRP